jgi:sporulation protein YlmC with PRC-barrel domain
MFSFCSDKKYKSQRTYKNWVIILKVSEFLGKKVLDKNAVEIGKVSDVDLLPKEGLINSITVSTGDMWLRNKNFEIKSADINQIGDYVLLNLEGSSIKEIVEEKEEKEENPKKTRLSLKDE